MTKKVKKSSQTAEKEQLEESLRPKRMNQFLGQEKIKKKLDIFIKAAQKRQEPLDHLLLYGPPGLGKTTLAHLVARELGVNIRITSGPAIERSGDLASILKSAASMVFSPFLVINKSPEISMKSPTSKLSKKNWYFLPNLSLLR